MGKQYFDQIFQLFGQFSDQFSLNELKDHHQPSDGSADFSRSAHVKIKMSFNRGSDTIDSEQKTQKKMEINKVRNNKNN